MKVKPLKMSDPSTPTAPSSESIMIDDIVELASNAVDLDKAGELQAAIYYYLESAKALEQVGQRLENARQYRARATELTDILEGRTQEEAAKFTRDISKQDGDANRAKFLLSEALNADEAGDLEDALGLYQEAVALVLDAKKKTSDKARQEELHSLAVKALERAEAIKAMEVNSPKKQPNPKQRLSTETAKRMLPPIDGLNLRESPNAASTFGKDGGGGGSGGGGSGGGAGGGGGGGQYSEEEKLVLRETSTINGRDVETREMVDVTDFWSMRRVCIPAARVAQAGQTCFQC